MKIGAKKNLLAVLIVPLLGLSLPALGAEGDAGKRAQPKRIVEKASRHMRASNLLDQQVKNSLGENLGQIQDLVIDVAAQRVHYAVLSFGGVLGIGDRLFAYPISAFKPSSERDELVLNVDKEKLSEAPGFERNNWPDWNDARYRREIERYFKTGAVDATPTGERMVRASEVIGWNVEDGAGRDVGEIEDLVVNIGSGRVAYAVLDFDAAGPQDRLLPLPLSALAFPPDRKRDLVLKVKKEELDMTRSFDENNWPDLNSPNYRRNMELYLAGFKTGGGTSAGSSAQGDAAGR